MKAATVGPIVRSYIGHRNKTASAPGTPDGYFGMSQQRYMPQYQRRGNLEGFEEELIARGKKRFIPKIFKSDADYPTVDMQSPGVAAGFAAPVGAVVGGIGGGLVGSALDGEDGMRAGAGVGAVTSALVAALIGYHGRSAKNDSIVESMRRVPAGATRRDIKADPVYQAEQDRMTQLEVAKRGR